jgi:hypothetical protein
VNNVTSRAIVLLLASGEFGVRPRSQPLWPHCDLADAITQPPTKGEMVWIFPGDPLPEIS